MKNEQKGCYFLRCAFLHRTVYREVLYGILFVERIKTRFKLIVCCAILYCCSYETTNNNLFREICQSEQCLCYIVYYSTQNKKYLHDSLQLSYKNMIE